MEEVDGPDYRLETYFYVLSDGWQHLTNIHRVKHLAESHPQISNFAPHACCWEISPDDDLHEDPDSSSGGLDDAQRHHEEVQDALHDAVVLAETEVADHNGLPVRRRVLGIEYF